MRTALGKGTAEKKTGVFLRRKIGKKKGDPAVGEETGEDCRRAFKKTIAFVL